MNQALPQTWKIYVTKSRRKTISISVSAGKKVLVKAPYGITDGELQRVLRDKADWISRQLEKLENLEEESAQLGYLSPGEIRELADRALQVLPDRVSHYAKILGVDYGRITIRNQKTCWGSCSGKGNLNFNCLLMLAPPEVADYVVVHELCHRLEMNHSPRFWSLVEGAMPDYRERRSWLKTNGPLLMKRMVGSRELIG